MFEFSRSARFVAVLTLVLGTVACSKTAPESGKEPEPAGPKAKETPKKKPAGEPAKPKTDAELIQGTWAFEWTEFEGKKEDGPVDRAVVFVGEKMIMKELDGDRTDPGSFRLDPTKTPKAIEIGRSERDPKDVVPGIYELNGDRLKLCFVRDPNGKRPTKFESAPGVLVWVLKRDKNLPEHKEPDGTGFAEAVVGKWRMSRGETAFAFIPARHRIHQGRTRAPTRPRNQELGRVVHIPVRQDRTRAVAGCEEQGRAPGAADQDRTHHSRFAGRRFAERNTQAAEMNPVARREPCLFVGCNEAPR
jgi:uncharacterized protein (TIGR03067 family)